MSREDRWVFALGAVLFVPMGLFLLVLSGLILLEGIQRATNRLPASKAEYRVEVKQ